MSQSISKRLASAGLKVAVTAGLIAITVRNADFGGILAHLASVRLGSLAMPFLALVGTAFLFAARWGAVLAGTARPLSSGALGRATFVGLFFNQALPTGLGGDVYRVWYGRRAGLPLPEALSSVVLDRVLALAATVAFLTAGLPLMLSLPGLASIRHLLMAIPVLAVGGLFFLALLDRLVAFLPMTQRLKGLADSLAALGRGERKLALSWPWGPLSLALALLNQALFGVAIYGIGQAIGIELSLIQALLLFPPVLLLSTLPVSLAGWGVREGAMVFFLGAAGIPAEAALTVSILFGLMTVVIALPGGLVWVLDRPVAGVAAVEAGSRR